MHLVRELHLLLLWVILRLRKLLLLLRHVGVMWLLVIGLRLDLVGFILVLVEVRGIELGVV